MLPGPIHHAPRQPSPATAISSLGNEAAYVTGWKAGAGLGALWQGMGPLPSPTVGQALRALFYLWTCREGEPHTGWNHCQPLLSPTWPRRWPSPLLPGVGGHPGSPAQPLPLPALTLGGRGTVSAAGPSGRSLCPPLLPLSDSGRD